MTPVDEPPNGSVVMVGEPVPIFELPDVRGGTVSLATELAKHRVALVFYRGGWCPLCNRQLAKLSGVYEAFKEREVEILAISSDQVEQGKNMLAKLGPPFPLLLDSTTDVISRYGLLVAGGSLMGDPLGLMLRKHDFALPAVVLVNRAGVASWVYRGRNYRDRPTSTQILDAVDSTLERR